MIDGTVTINGHIIMDWQAVNIGPTGDGGSIYECYAKTRTRRGDLKRYDFQVITKREGAANLVALIMLEIQERQDTGW